MTETLTGLNVPDFTASATSAKMIRLSDLRGSNVVLYFYPRDNTPGCTNEGVQFAEHYAAFRKSNCEVFGISRDSLRSHENFKAKMGFPFELLSDEDEGICNMFGVIKMKNMYGKKVRGIERSTFVMDATGVMRREWRGVKVPGHAGEVLDFVKTL